MPWGTWEELRGTGLGLVSAGLPVGTWGTVVCRAGEWGSNPLLPQPGSQEAPWSQQTSRETQSVSVVEGTCVLLLCPPLWRFLCPPLGFVSHGLQEEASLGPSPVLACVISPCLSCGCPWAWSWYHYLEVDRASTFLARRSPDTRVQREPERWLPRCIRPRLL